MVDYKNLYIALFQGITKAIDVLQESQRKTEEMFIDSDETPVIRMLRPERENVSESDETGSDK